MTAEPAAVAPAALSAEQRERFRALAGAIDAVAARDPALATSLMGFGLSGIVRGARANPERLYGQVLALIGFLLVVRDYTLGDVAELAAIGLERDDPEAAAELLLRGASETIGP